MPMLIRFQIAGFRSRRSANPTTSPSSVPGVPGVSAFGSVGDDRVYLGKQTDFFFRSFHRTVHDCDGCGDSFYDQIN
jgi:hypothetical protein